MVVGAFFYFYAIVILAVFCSFTDSKQLNTHQTIKTSPPKRFKLNLAYGDEVNINLFNTNALYYMQVQIDGISLQTGQQVCFADQVCSMKTISQWNDEGLVTVLVFAYQYSYEILLNGEVIQQEVNVASNFLAGKFFYSTFTPPGKYTIRVSYQSDFVPSIVMNFIDKNVTIPANQTNQILLQIQNQMTFYQIFFTQTQTEQLTIDEMIDRFFSVTIQLPNQFLKGCDGTNIYDPKIRACPILDYKTQDTLQISKIGTFPTFQLQEKQKVKIKITIVEVKKWSDFFNNQLLTVYIGKGKDPSEYYGLSKQEIDSKFQIKQQCSIKQTSYTFVFNLQEGSYVMMPLYLQAEINGFAYLYERFNGDKLVESFYSVLPTMATGKKYFQQNFMLEFKSHQEKMTEFEITCNDPIILLQSVVLDKTQISPSNDRTELQIIYYQEKYLMNPDLNKAQIFTSLKPNKTYLLLFSLCSQKKFVKYQQENKRTQGQTQPAMSFQQWQAIGDFYLETSFIEVKVKNGKFPHRKLSSGQQEKEQIIINNESHQSQTKQSELTQEKSNDTPNDESNTQPVDSKEQSENQSHLTTQEQKQSSSSLKSTSILIQALGAIIVILIMLVALYLCLLNRAPVPQNGHKQLVSEQASGSITMPDSAMEISQVIKSEQSMSRSQTTEVEQSPKPQQKLFELKEIEHESVEQ